jgi:hypothetical protein
MEGFDPEPVRELSEDEPRTPMWLPALGGVLLVGWMALWIAGANDAGAVAAASASAGSSAAPATSGPALRLTPEQLQRLREAATKRDTPEGVR